jgi:hypothetical protein
MFLQNVATYDGESGIYWRGKSFAMCGHAGACDTCVYSPRRSTDAQRWIRPPKAYKRACCGTALQTFELKPIRSARGSMHCTRREIKDCPYARALPNTTSMQAQGQYLIEVMTRPSRGEPEGIPKLICKKIGSTAPIFGKSTSNGDFYCFPCKPFAMGRCCLLA